MVMHTQLARRHGAAGGALSSPTCAASTSLSSMMVVQLQVSPLLCARPVSMLELITNILHPQHALI